MVKANSFEEDQEIDGQGVGRIKVVKTSGWLYILKDYITKTRNVL